MILTRAVFVLFLLVATATAKEAVSVNEQEQANIIFICDLAAQSPIINRAIRAQVSAFCVAWETKIKPAEEPAEEPVKKPDRK